MAVVHVGPEWAVGLIMKLEFFWYEFETAYCLKLVDRLKVETGGLMGGLVHGRAGPSCQIRPVDLRLGISPFLDLRFQPWPLSGSEMGGLRFARL